MRKLIGKTAVIGLCAMAVSASLAGCASGKGDKEHTKLTFQIWDVAQRKGMQDVIDAYTAMHPNVEIQLQVTSWDEYWTKLEAAAESNQLPDIFWMHTNEILKYADYGMLADLTELYEEESPGYYEEHFSKIALNNARGSDGRIYGIPKDKDTVCLVYNKEMFDEAGVSFPDENWTWDDLVKSSQEIYSATGKYGFLAYSDEQLGYWNFVYQAGGQILSDDKTKGEFLNPGTRKGMEFYIGLQDYEWCPDQKYFAETNPGTAFFSEQGAMYLEGNWNLMVSLENYPDMIGKWDVAVLPKCPDPLKGDGRATISNNLCYSTGAHGKKLEEAKKFLKFLGTEEGQRIQGESGAAIPAYQGLEHTWIQFFEGKLNVQKCVDMFEYGVQSVNNQSRPNWKSKVNDIILRIYSGEVDLDEGLALMQKAVDEAAAP